MPSVCFGWGQDTRQATGTHQRAIVMTSRYKGRSGFREIARLYPYVVEIVVPPGGLGRRLDDMHEFHRQRGIKDQRGPRRRDDEHDYLRWCFADLATAEAFAAEFGGEVLQQKSRPHC